MKLDHTKPNRTFTTKHISAHISNGIIAAFHKEQFEPENRYNHRLIIH